MNLDTLGLAASFLLWRQQSFLFAQAAAAEFFYLLRLRRRGGRVFKIFTYFCHFFLDLIRAQC
jgi:hypothetical protein